jgi:hypothetical protein
MEELIKDLKRLDELENQIITKADEILESDFDILFDNANCVRLKYKDVNVVISVFLENLRSDSTIVSYHIDNEFIWDYINRRFFENPKSINFEETIKVDFIPLKLSDESAKKLQDIHNNEEYITLRKQIYGE